RPNSRGGTCASQRASTSPSASSAASGNPGRRRPLTPSQRPNARFAPTIRPFAAAHSTGVVSASRSAGGGTADIAPLWGKHAEARTWRASGATVTTARLDRVVHLVLERVDR